MLEPPIAPMLARLTGAIPAGEGWQYDPKWDGFRALVFRDGTRIYIQSRDLKPLNRYFPELIPPLLASLPERAVVDGEIVIPGPEGLDFEALLLRIHPAASRIAKLAGELPASFVAFDLLALGDESLLDTPQGERRARLERALLDLQPSIHLTPATRDVSVARTWWKRFEGAGLDGIVARPLDAIYHPGERAMLKIKHARTADCVVGGFRWHKQGPGTMVGSLLLGLYDGAGRLHHVGVTATFTAEMRRQLAKELTPLRSNIEDHPWAGEWDDTTGGDSLRPGAVSRWNRGKSLSWVPLAPERVCEVKYDHLQGRRFRHATGFVRFRPDKRPSDCTYDQLEETPPYELREIFGLREISGPPRGLETLKP